MTRRWEPADPEAVVREYLAGSSMEEVGARRGVSRPAVSRFLRRSGVETRRGMEAWEPPPGLADEYRSGVGAQDLGTRYGVSRMTVTRALVQMGVRIRHGNGCPHDPKRSCRPCKLERQRDKNREIKYGMARHELEAMLARQGGECAGCRDPIALHGDGERAFVDHCHATGAVRALLCMNCNTLIGHAKDSPQTLRRLARLLDQRQLPALAPGLGPVSEAAE